jgi:hypothetical protein
MAGDVPKFSRADVVVARMGIQFNVYMHVAISLIQNWYQWTVESPWYIVTFPVFFHISLVMTGSVTAHVQAGTYNPLTYVVFERIER